MRLNDRLVDLFVLRDTAQEITFSFLRGQILVIRIPRTDFEGDVDGDDESEGLESAAAVDEFFAAYVYEFGVAGEVFEGF